MDHDAFREEEVIAVAAISVLVLLLVLSKHLWQSPYLTGAAPIVLFAFWSVIQQLFIERGSITFGLKYAVVLLSCFIPAWVAMWIGPFALAAERTIDRAIRSLLIVSAATVYASFAFGWGEVHVGGESMSRAFGWLGDSFAPVFAFFVIYYIVQRQYTLTLLALGAMIITGGKAAAMMLLVAYGVYVFATKGVRSKILVLLLYAVGAGVILGPYSNEVAALLSRNMVEYSYYTRVLSIEIGLEYFQRAPLTGVGINQSMVDIQHDTVALAESLGLDTYYEIYQIHNAFVRTAAETGLPGVILLLWFVLATCRVGLRGVRLSFVAANPLSKALLSASGVWVVSFVLVYQTTGWFEAGHPQLSWLMVFVAISRIIQLRQRPQYSSAGRAWVKPATAIPFGSK
jgi:O-antigen ligase